MIGANLGSRSITAVYSNIGIIRLPEEYKEYIQHFGIFASTNSLQMCSCSYGDEMVLGFTSKIPNDSIQRNFQRMLGEENVSHRELKNEFPGYGEKHRLEKKENQKVIQTFSFLCLAIAVICGMINFMMAGVLNWFWFAGAGCAHTGDADVTGSAFRAAAPVSAVCAAFAAQPRRVPTGSKKTGRFANVWERCGNGKRRRRRASNLPTNNFQNQYNSKCS